MRKIFAAACLAAVCAFAPAFAHAQGQPDPAVWRPLDPEQTLYIDTVHGRIVIEMYPEVAPRHVQRIKELSREKFFDGLTFHRVIDDFMAQGGDPSGDGTGGSTKPDLPKEFEFRRGPEMPFVQAAQSGGGRLGFFKALPILTQPDLAFQPGRTRDGKAAAQALHCPGVASMARAQDENSANSQFFLMRQHNIRVDGKYSVWGRVIWGQDAVMKLAIGEPPPNPDKMLQVRVASDLPAGEQAPLYIMRTESPEFLKIIEQTRANRKADFSVCDVPIPVRVPKAVEAAKETERKERPWWRLIPFLP
jgi:peptidylprolyl isomerase